MNLALSFTPISLLNLAILVGLCIYLGTKVRKHRSAACLIGSLAPVFGLQLGTYLFTMWPDSAVGACLVLSATALVPLSLVPTSHIMGRAHDEGIRSFWRVYYLVQIALFLFFLYGIFSGRVIEWVTAILDQPIILVGNFWRFYFLNIVGSAVLSMLCFDRTLNQANAVQREHLKFVFIAFLSFAVYFSYLSINILLGSYISNSMLQLGTVLTLVSSTLLAFSFVKYPLWNVTIRVSRDTVFGTLSITAAAAYLLISGALLELLRSAQSQDLTILLPVFAFALVVPFLTVYLSPSLHNRAKNFITRNFFRHKYDYRDLWMKFSEKSSGSLNVHELLPRVADFIVCAMFVRQVSFWLRSPTSNTYRLAYCHDRSVDYSALSPLYPEHLQMADENGFIPVSDNFRLGAGELPLVNFESIRALGIERLKLVKRDHEILGLIGIGKQDDPSRANAEDDRLLSSVSTQLGHLILTHKLSDELLLAREWDSFNRFASFILHDLKNLATLQGMTLDNAKHFAHKPEFIADAFATFHQTTEKMITLIASLSVQRGQFSLKQQPVNILEVIAHTFDDLRLTQRNGVHLHTAFPPASDLRPISGDPDLLKKAFTNLLLNAIQSLPKGEGAVEVTVSPQSQGKIVASIRDTGCGIPPERLETLFRPFQTTKENGLGIGLCHTRSIIEVHGGQIRVESQINAGTKVEVELPTL